MYNDIRKLMLIAITATISFGATAQKRVLRFNDDGKFKIVQFTDVHYIYENPKSDIAIERINEVLDNEKPDLVLFTGDVIFGKPAEKGYRKVMEQVSKRNIPFAVTFGNHDNEQGLSKKELLDILKTIPGNLTDSVAGVPGASNFILPIKSYHSNHDAWILYCLDSHTYCGLKDVKGYDYIKSEQIGWYKKESNRLNSSNPNDTIPALAFFHIPLPEYRDAANDESCILIGLRKEKSCPPALNSGMFVAMKEMGDIKGVFVGHDHDNDYAVLKNGILLAYGHYTGGKTVYNNLPNGNGARVIILTEGDKSFDSYIVTKGCEISNKIKFPDSFLKE